MTRWIPDLNHEFAPLARICAEEFRPGFVHPVVRHSADVVAPGRLWEPEDRQRNAHGCEHHQANQAEPEYETGQPSGSTIDRHPDDLGGLPVGCLPSPRSPDISGRFAPLDAAAPIARFLPVNGDRQDDERDDGML